MTGNRLTILLVEDDPDTVLTFGIVLQRLGHTMQAVCDAASALRALRAVQVDVVLCDLGLPGGASGLDLARVMKQDADLRLIPIVALTGFGQLRDRQLTTAAGFAAHLTKPVGLAEFRSVLATFPARDAASGG